MGWWAGRKAGIFKVRLDLGQIERQRYRKIERHRNKEA